MPVKPASAWIFLASAGCAASVCGHRIMEFLTSAHVLSGDYGDYDHVAVAPVGFLALCAAMAGVAYVLGHTRAGGRASGIAIAARALVSMRLVTSVAVVLTLQLGVLNIGENLEEMTASGRLCEGLQWLGGPAGAALLVHVLLAVAFTLLLRRSLGAVLKTCDALVRAVAALVFTPLFAAPRTVFRKRRQTGALRHCARTRACENGLRGPPLTF